MKYRLADRLHKTVAEVDAMDVAEFNGWIAYLTILAKEQKKG